MPSTGLTKEQERNIIQHLNRKRLRDDKQALFRSMYSHGGKWIQIAPAQEEKSG